MPTLTPDPITIRQACRDDTAALSDLLQAINLSLELNAKPIAEIQKRVSSRLATYLAHENHTLLVAESIQGQGTRLDGYIAIHWLPTLFLPAPEGYVSDLFVREGERGNGIGGRLLAAAQDQANQRGCCRLSLLNNIGRISYQRGFYRKHGWLERSNMVNFVFPLAAADE